MSAKPSYLSIAGGAAQTFFRVRLYRTLFVALLLMLLIGYLGPQSRRFVRSHFAPFSRRPAAAVRNVHLLLPATHKDANLCKTVVSSLILGYPRATIINWGVAFNNSDATHGTHIGKLSGISAWLDSLPPSHDDDLVIAADAYDVWFQLRPEVLIERFLDINRRAMERIRSELGDETVDQYGIDQTIVFSPQKKCGHRDLPDPFCDVIPQSTLPEDVFGPDTDVRRPGKWIGNPDVKMRPRSLNSGTMAGRVGPMRKLYREASKRGLENSQGGSDQRILSALFGEQETWRRQLRDSNNSGPQTEKQPAGPTMEFGIGLDYESSMGKATVFSKDDLAWISYNDSARIRNMSMQLTGTDQPKIPERLVHDIERSRPPFADIVGESEADEALRRVPWSDVTLFTNMWTGFTPAMIHHNEWRNNLKSRRVDWWDKKPWYRGRVRELLDGVARADPTQKVVIKDKDGGADTLFQNLVTPGEIEVGLGARSYTGELLTWGEMCDDYDGLIFGDGKGHWRDPR